MTKITLNKESIGKMVMPKLQEWLPAVDLPKIIGGDELNLTLDITSEDGYLLSVVDIRVRIFDEPMERMNIVVDKSVIVKKEDT